MSTAGAEGTDGAVMAARCEVCGRFTAAANLHVVWGPIQTSGPDHEACTDCVKRKNARSS